VHKIYCNPLWINGLEKWKTVQPIYLLQCSFSIKLVLKVLQYRDSALKVSVLVLPRVSSYDLEIRINFRSIHISEHIFMCAHLLVVELCVCFIVLPITC
jgi:hypothetical protein